MQYQAFILSHTSHDVKEELTAAYAMAAATTTGSLDGIREG